MFTLQIIKIVCQIKFDMFRINFHSKEYVLFEVNQGINMYNLYLLVFSYLFTDFT